MSAQETRTIKLESPIEVNGDKVFELTFDLPLKWKKVKGLFNGADEAGRIEGLCRTLFALPASCVQELSADDIASIMQEVSPFLDRFKRVGLTE